MRDRPGGLRPFPGHARQSPGPRPARSAARPKSSLSSVCLLWRRRHPLRRRRWRGVRTSLGDEDLLSQRHQLGLVGPIGVSRQRGVLGDREGSRPTPGSHNLLRRVRVPRDDRALGLLNRLPLLQLLDVLSTGGRRLPLLNRSLCPVHRQRGPRRVGRIKSDRRHRVVHRTLQVADGLLHLGQPSFEHRLQLEIVQQPGGCHRSAVLSDRPLGVVGLQRRKPSPGARLDRC